jgi:chromosome segregation ATPase
MQKKTS